MTTEFYALSSAEQKLAEQNCGVVFKFLHTKKLPVDEWFDVVIFRYLRTVKIWFNRPDLYQYEFSTLAWKNMNSAVYNERKKQDRRIKTVSLDEPIRGTDGLTLGDLITDENMRYLYE